VNRSWQSKSIGARRRKLGRCTPLPSARFFNLGRIAVPSDAIPGQRARQLGSEPMTSRPQWPSCASRHTNSRLHRICWSSRLPGAMLASRRTTRCRPGQAHVRAGSWPSHAYPQSPGLSQKMHQCLPAKTAVFPPILDVDGGSWSFQVRQRNLVGARGSSLRPTRVCSSAPPAPTGAANSVSRFQRPPAVRTRFRLPRHADPADSSRPLQRGSRRIGGDHVVACRNGSAP